MARLPHGGAGGGIDQTEAQADTTDIVAFLCACIPRSSPARLRTSPRSAPCPTSQRNPCRTDPSFPSGRSRTPAHRTPLSRPGRYPSHFQETPHARYWLSCSGRRTRLLEYPRARCRIDSPSEGAQQWLEAGTFSPLGLPTLPASRHSRRRQEEVCRARGGVAGVAA